MQNTQHKPVNRPKNLNLLTIRLPINAVISILHRVSGIGLFLGLPLLLWALQSLVKSPQSYAALQGVLHHWLVKLVLIGFAWAFFHHFYAGIRHLLQDIHWMTSLQKARLSSKVLLFLVAISVALFALWLW